jgi:nicotinamide-nucleotide amidase
MIEVRAQVLAIGTELLLHGRRDTNGPELCQRLTRLGFRVEGLRTVADDLEPLTLDLAHAAGRAALVITTGGLGPTDDDRTREAIAAVCGRPLRRDAGLVAALERRFAALGRPMPESNRRQGDLPEGGEALSNPEGSAPGLWVEHPGGVIVALPGPPIEMRAVLAEGVEARLERRFLLPAVAVRYILTSGISESALEDRIGDLYARDPAVQMTVLAAPGAVELFVVARGQDAMSADAAAQRIQTEAVQRLGDAVVGDTPMSLAAAVGARLRRLGRTLAVAESCTAGLLGALLTDDPGASDFFLGGVIAYSDDVKRAELGVDVDLLRHDGAVSEGAARLMAEGARRRFGSDYALALTGIAGPGGGSDQKPVGLVWIALAGESGTQVLRRQFHGGRTRVRQWAATAALDLLRRRVDADAATSA